MRDLFEAVYWLALVGEVIVRAPFQKHWKSAARIDRRVTRTDRTLVSLLWITMIILPLIYSVTDWLDFADYRLPGWMGWLGIVLLGGALVVFALAHKSLKSNWSPTLEIYEGHTLVTDGIYRYIRHPMYASQWLWGMAQMLLLQNWIAGPVNLLYFIPFYFLRTRAEERMLLDVFGDRYRELMKRTGGVIPRIGSFALSNR